MTRMNAEPSMRSGGRVTSSAARISELKRLPTALVVAALNLPKAAERNKYRCPDHGGDTLHVYEFNAYCYGCRRSFDNIDLVRLALRIKFQAALEWLAERFSSGDVQSPATAAARTARVRVDARLHTRILCRLFGITRLGRSGREFLEGRALDAEFAERNGGFRSIEAEEWARYREALLSEYSMNELMSAGLAGLGYFSDRSQWTSPVSALLIPYHDLAGELVTMRMRKLSDSAGPKYLAMKGSSASVAPFNGFRAYTEAAKWDVLHVTDSELDAWTLYSAHNRLAVAAPGALGVTPEWFDVLATVSGVVVWVAGSPAGETFEHRVVRAIERSRGEGWFERHTFQRITLPRGEDVSSLHVVSDLRQYRGGVL